MKDNPFDFEEFINKTEDCIPESETNEDSENFTEESLSEQFETENIDVQKAVVESLAADKAALDCEIENLKNSLSEKEQLLEEKSQSLLVLKEELEKKNLELDLLKKELQSKNSEIEKIVDAHFEMQSRNPNNLALLDREVELPDRFPGETRDTVLEIIKTAQKEAETKGRRRRAQLLEAVLVANEPNGELFERRSLIEKAFADNGNIISGEVIEILEKLSISYKEGEVYLLPSEIILRNY